MLLASEIFWKIIWVARPTASVGPLTVTCTAVALASWMQVLDLALPDDEGRRGVGVGGIAKRKQFDPHKRGHLWQLSVQQASKTVSDLSCRIVSAMALLEQMHFKFREN